MHLNFGWASFKIWGPVYETWVLVVRGIHGSVLEEFFLMQFKKGVYFYFKIETAFHCFVNILVNSLLMIFDVHNCFLYFIRCFGVVSTYIFTGCAVF